MSEKTGNWRFAAHKRWDLDGDRIVYGLSMKRGSEIHFVEVTRLEDIERGLADLEKACGHAPPTEFKITNL